MPEGDPAQTPVPPPFSDDWQNGKPDLVIKAPHQFTVPADGPDLYLNEHIKLNLSKDVWLHGFDLRASSPKAIHHLLYFTIPSSEAKALMAREAKRDSGMRLTPGMTLIGTWSPGTQPESLPGGLAWKLPRGTDLLIQYHFHPTGKEEIEQSTVGLYFSRAPSTHSLQYIRLPVAYGFFSGIDIPAGRKDYKVSARFVLPVDVRAVSVAAHAHYLGKSMMMRATLPDSRPRTLLDIPHWDLAWQTHYFFQDSVFLPKGTILDSEITWDNSAENPKNPSAPPVRVKWGERTADEMGGINLLVYPVREADLGVLKSAYDLHYRQVAGVQIRKDPSLIPKIRRVLGE